MAECHLTLAALTLLLPGPAAKRWAGNASVPKGASLDLGAFSISLAVRDLAASRTSCDKSAQKPATVTDVRELQRRLTGQGAQLERRADESSTGPASFVAVDPDGNPILVDQHV